MVLGKKWLFFIGNGDEIWPLEKGRESPVSHDTSKLEKYLEIKLRTY